MTYKKVILSEAVRQDIDAISDFIINVFHGLNMLNDTRRICWTN